MNSEDNTSADTAHLPDASSPGARLRAAREARNLDLTHVAADTRIPRRHLEAIEEGDFESLPSRAYAIGFSRTYAKAVGLDDVAITEAVRTALADGSMRRTVPTPGIEPGDPGRLPSAGLAWTAAAAVLVLAIGIFAFYSSYFGAGAEPDTLRPPEPAATTAAAPVATAPAASGPVVFTALEDGIWLRIYEEGGERLAERTLKQGETLEVPVTARDPRINTGRPDALGVTVGGQSLGKLSDRSQTISGVPVSAAALAPRLAPTPAAGGTPGVASAAPQVAQPPAPRRIPASATQATATTAEPVAAPAPAPEAAEPEAL